MKYTMILLGGLLAISNLFAQSESNVSMLYSKGRIAFEEEKYLESLKLLFAYQQSSSSKLSQDSDLAKNVQKAIDYSEFRVRLKYSPQAGVAFSPPPKPKLYANSSNTSSYERAQTCFINDTKVTVAFLYRWEGADMVHVKLSPKKTKVASWYLVNGIVTDPKLWVNYQSTPDDNSGKNQYGNAFHAEKTNSNEPYKCEYSAKYKFHIDNGTVDIERVN